MSEKEESKGITNNFKMIKPKELKELLAKGLGA